MIPRLAELLVAGVALTLFSCAAPPAPRHKAAPDALEDEDEDQDPPPKKGSSIGAPAPAPDDPPSAASAALAKTAIFAHSPKTLYMLDPATSALTKIGDLPCLRADEELIDIAVSAKGSIFATSWGTTPAAYTRFLTIDPKEVSCKAIKELQVTGDVHNYPNALSFVPKGTVDPTSEALVGYDNRGTSTVYVRVDLTTGATTDIGVLEGDEVLEEDKIQSSGDIVALDQGKAYLTARHPDGESDLLVEVNPATGRLVRQIGAIGFNKLYGLGYWDGKAYGFSGTGQIARIDISTGRGTAVTVASSPTAFYGAAVTTLAPK